MVLKLVKLAALFAVADLAAVSEAVQMMAAKAKGKGKGKAKAKGKKAAPKAAASWNACSLLAKGLLGETLSYKADKRGTDGHTLTNCIFRESKYHKYLPALTKEDTAKTYKAVEKQATEFKRVLGDVKDILTKCEAEGYRGKADPAEEEPVSEGGEAKVEEGGEAKSAEGEEAKIAAAEEAAKIAAAEKAAEVLAAAAKDATKTKDMVVEVVDEAELKKQADAAAAAKAAGEMRKKADDKKKKSGAAGRTAFWTLSAMAAYTSAVLLV